jgi:hypothetical protein
MTADGLRRDPAWVKQHPGQEPVDGCNAIRPCPWVSCKYHLYLQVDPMRSGGVQMDFPARHVDEMAETCALDVADRGGAILEEVG